MALYFREESNIMCALETNIITMRQNFHKLKEGINTRFRRPLEIESYL